MPALTRFLTTLFVIGATSAPGAQAASEQVIFSFTGLNGALPTNGLLYVGGALYGMAAGVFYKVTPAGVETTLDPSGYVSFSPLINTNNTLFGINNAGDGSVFKSSLSGHVVTLHTFTGTPDGNDPCCGLLKIGGTMYGTTAKGGANNTGAVFSVTTGGVEKIIYSFKATGSGDGVNPTGNLVNIGGTFYGTTLQGGANNDGTIFSITPSGTEEVLYSFKGTSAADGIGPNGLVGVSGLLYGTTLVGGKYGVGTVFKFNRTTGIEKVIHAFKGAPTDGGEPNGGLVYSNGAIYGTTQIGGTTPSCSNASNACGTVWSVTTAGVETLLHSFTSTTTDGGFPEAGLTLVDGTFYGTTVYGGAGNVGTVYSIIP